jgi:hypothetical protein
MKSTPIPYKIEEIFESDCGELELTASLAPRLANSKAIPRPIPLLAPVTRHTFPFNDMPVLDLPPFE